MHRVKSSYYAFRDFLGKRSELRFLLENFLVSDDIWADFEDSLARFNMNIMGSRFIVGDWLDNFNVYDEDASAADFYLAVETAADPMETIAEDLPKRFRRWVETLSVGTNDRPLKKMFRNGKVLCFNYTEFVETLYGVDKENICYIHGSRKNKKGNPKEKLILGHLSGASDTAFDFDDDLVPETKDPYKLEMIDIAQENIIQIVSEYDKELTKNCADIIKKHKGFFESLKKIETVIVVGHSFSPVDWKYFIEVVSQFHDMGKVNWFFGCYGLRDLNNLEKLLLKLCLDKSKVAVFRTDTIFTVPEKMETMEVEPSKMSYKELCVSLDKRWSVTVLFNILCINEYHENRVCLKVMFSEHINKAFFLYGNEMYMIALHFGINSGVYLFKTRDDEWEFVGELESIKNQGIINSRLSSVYFTEDALTFVYNNRVRHYSLDNGELIENIAARNAPQRKYSGENITYMFR